MKAKNIILAGAGTVVGAIALKAAFNFGVKMGIATILPDMPNLPSGKEWSKSEKDIAKLIAIKNKKGENK